ncbi:MAG: OB-fold domain-containing protein [Evtepia sp.]
MAEKTVIKTAPFLYRVENGNAVLTGNRCKVCGYEMFPAQEQCTKCFSHDIEEFLLPRTGVLYSFSRVVAAPAGFVGPYVLCYADFGDFRIFGMVVGTDDPKIGDKLEVTEGVLRENDEEIYRGYQFKVVKEEK